MSTETFRPLGDQADAARALLALMTQFPELPAASFDLGRYHSPDLTINVHNDPAGFEQWRAALDLDPQNSIGKPHNTFYAVEVPGEFAGVRLELVGYLPLPVGDGVEPAAA
ncbi:hypothetical protein [Streptacidiphilus neutrinimicus]|uniref:hypothetical protein n=1 Tax=Streptacidiphilus neutrinimicus TaxID=105420 RepID=UPI0005A69EE7|nr:hypothetical protein [Streptacidiphilus neutrinimicus]